MTGGFFKKLVKVVFWAVLAGLVLIIVTNVAVWMSSKDKIHVLEDIGSNTGCDCIIVLGCGVWGETPTPLL